MSHHKHTTYSKARMLTQLMRVAAINAVSPTAQAVLAIIIAEAWPIPNTYGLWRTKMSQARLATRTSRDVRTIQRAINELREQNLLIVRAGRVRSVSQFVLGPPKDDISVASNATPVSAQTRHQCRPGQESRSLSQEANR